MVGTFGIVNVTRDSFSDGGCYLDPARALERARELRGQGADVIDLGAESTHPDAEDVPAGEEIRRLAPLVRALRAEGADVSVDTRKPEVMRAVLDLGAGWINDVNGFRGEQALAVAAAAPAHVRFVAMFSRSRAGRAERAVAAAGGDDLRAFFAERIAAFAACGIGGERLVLDPGMGFFLGSTAAASLSVLKHLGALRAFGAGLMVSASRKSFLGELTGRPALARGPATLAAELWAARHGAAWIRTHDVAAFRDAWAVECAIEAAR
ncbi:MAG: dihydropteroate synthase [Planctomycetes bacterium]|nr:dihydropteroate synthase [Planctomycetota bacterium]